MLVFAPQAFASDIAEALNLAQEFMGEDAADGLEAFLNHQPDEALALLLSPVVEPDRPLSAYSEAPPTTAPHPHFARLGAQRLNFGRLRPFIEEAAAANRLPVALIDAVIRTESGYRPNAVSRAGAMGLMQLMPKTAAAMGAADPLDPRENIMAGAQYLRKQYDRFKDLALALAAYNAGPSRVAKARGVPPLRETKRYVATVLKRFRESPLR
ncbi:MAG: lytic transglycosylase domain-containing protein [Myxococcota bacterium]